MIHGATDHDECPLCLGNQPRNWREEAMCHEECLLRRDREIAVDADIDAARDEAAQ